MGRVVRPGPFRATRDDGRSDRRVIFELAHGAAVDHVFSYDELLSALREGISPEDKNKIDRDRVYRAVSSANRTLLREDRRYLSVVENVGYRMIAANEHLAVSLIKKSQAQKYLTRGIALLSHVRLDELDSNQRAMHEGQLMIMTGLNEAVKESARRHDRTDSLIEDLMKSNQEIVDRLDRIEGTTT
jgi:hypothetical protein